jgi:hypothetical protein
MPDISEGNLRFSFIPDCEAIKFDDSPWYRHTQRDHDKGMDILAVQDQHHWWIEVKDCAGYEADNLPRMNPSEPPDVDAWRKNVKAAGVERVVGVHRKKMFVVEEVAAKLQSTLVSLMAAKRTQPAHPHRPELLSYMSVVDDHNPWTVVLVLTWEARDFKRLAIRLRDKFTNRLAAFDVEVYIVDETSTAPNQPWAMTRLP